MKLLEVISTDGICCINPADIIVIKPEKMTDCALKPGKIVVREYGAIFLKEPYRDVVQRLEIMDIVRS